MSKSRKRKSLIIFLVLIAVLFVASMLVENPGHSEDIREVMQDVVLHNNDKISLFGLMLVNPAVISAFTVTGMMLLFALIVRIVVIPRFQPTPGRFQLVLETVVGLFNGLARTNSPHRNKFLGAYLFAAGSYIFVGTCFELLGLQAITATGHSISLPAPLADINGALCMGCLSYLIIMSGGIATNGVKGIFKTLKDFSLPISMSFRLFGALLSGALVTELIYYFTNLSYVLPVAVAVLFTLLHALIQAYVLTMLVSIFYGESSEPPHKREDTDRETANDIHITGMEVTQ